MNAFLRAVEQKTLAEHEARLAGARRLAELPDQRLPRNYPPDTPGLNTRERSIRGRLPMSVRLAFREGRRGGLSAAQLAERHGCSERTVLRHLRGLSLPAAEVA